MQRIDHPPDSFLGIILDVLHIGGDNIEPEMLNHVVHFLHAFFIGRNLRFQIAEIVMEIPGRIFVAREDVFDFGLKYRAFGNQLDVVE